MRAHMRLQGKVAVVTGKQHSKPYHYWANVTGRRKWLRGRATFKTLPLLGKCNSAT